MTLFLASSALAFASLVLLVRGMFRCGRHPAGIVIIASILLLGSCVANPLARYLAFAAAAETARGQMLSDAQEAHCLGKPASWLVARYGRPHRVVRIGKTQHWWYTPGPSYYVHEDYVGFRVEHGRVVSAYIQVN